MGAQGTAHNSGPKPLMMIELLEYLAKYLDVERLRTECLLCLTQHDIVSQLVYVCQRCRAQSASLAGTVTAEHSPLRAGSGGRTVEREGDARVGRLARRAAPRHTRSTARSQHQ